MRRGAGGTGTEVSDVCVCVCEGSRLPAEPDQEDRPETRGWGPDAPGGALPSLTQPLRPPQPQGAGAEGQAPLWAPLCLTGSDGGVSPGSTSVSQAQTLLLRHLTNPNSDSKCCLSSLKKLCNKFMYGTVYHKFNDQMENVIFIYL